MYRIGQHVQLHMSGEKGVVDGHINYAAKPDQFLVEYVDGNGCQKKEWFEAGSLRPDKNHVSTQAEPAT